MAGDVIRIYTIWEPYDGGDPVCAWADVKETAKQARIVTVSERAAWGFATIVHPERHARSEVAAWQTYAATLRDEIERAQRRIIKTQEWLALAERHATEPTA